jgi:hypothetical protein
MLGSNTHPTRALERKEKLAILTDKLCMLQLPVSPQILYEFEQDVVKELTFSELA